MAWMRAALPWSAGCEAMGETTDEGAAPPGRLVFAVGEVAGGLQVVQVWTSRAALDAFNAAVFLPALARLGGAGFPAPPTVVDFETLFQAGQSPAESGFADPAESTDQLWVSGQEADAEAAEQEHLTEERS